MHDLLQDFPVVIDLPVAWGEMDAFQHVNNTVYFRYFESVRIACFDRLGVFDLMKETGVGPILASAQCRFRVPLSYPDTVSVGTRITGVEGDRFLMEYRVISHRHQRIAADGEGVIVSYDYREKRKAPLPKELVERIARLGA